ncbi:MAG: hypothetical protein ACXABY_11945 [Candidatus Thorarchaeota archaeon]
MKIYWKTSIAASLISLFLMFGFGVRVDRVGSINYMLATVPASIKASITKYLQKEDKPLVGQIVMDRWNTLGERFLEMYDNKKIPELDAQGFVVMHWHAFEYIDGAMMNMNDPKVEQAFLKMAMEQMDYVEKVLDHFEEI